MDEKRPLFIMAGNGPYENRGCEAIVRGTTKILREYFRDPRFLCLSHFQNENQYQQQCLKETDEAIIHLHSFRLNKRKFAQNFWKPFYLGYAYDYLCHPKALKYRIYRQMLPYLDDAVAVLSVGGDNYSLDYGVPTLFTDLDDIAIQKGKPIILWGASVGPFSAMPDYEQYTSHHLKKVTGIFARESVTIDYLKGIGVTENIYPVADPAFLMDPVKPKGIEDVFPIDEDAIGLNLSPLMAGYVTGSDLEAWIGIAASIIEGVAKKTGRQVYLIPHVTTPTSNDHAFMQKALSLIKNQNGDITLVSPGYNAAETKWIISQMAFFAGARTHSTIAALSSCIPTLSFAYSIKAQGINRDIFEHTNYCMEPRDLNAEAVADRITSMFDESATIRKYLAERIPSVQKSALNAGIELKRLLGEH
ncbi:polysaccharide pyruvyl transferase family protein [Methanofollis formosanus]|uniref:Polysaccharide pyruvyl transferase family protein n=1 Tax=Methanofollis formosanus TaxID=299308 RepID=A0A8G1EGK6_9EURY|nr:polysaccharide pyruvyl transferase family protein [Methanofollis formosanus]QYZ79905.1 polysaccharide pyruvyl transferase family protein [Methanofollis formosanus]